MRQTRRSLASWSTSCVALLLLAGLLASPAIAQCDQAGTNTEATLENNAYFEVLEDGMLQFFDGVYWEIVENDDGVFIRYGTVNEDGDLAIAGEAPCHCPSGCFAEPDGKCTIQKINDNLAKCYGGCYRHGDACESCKW